MTSPPFIVPLWFNRSRPELPNTGPNIKSLQALLIRLGDQNIFPVIWRHSSAWSYQKHTYISPDRWTDNECLLNRLRRWSLPNSSKNNFNRNNQGLISTPCRTLPSFTYRNIVRATRHSAQGSVDLAAPPSGARPLLLTVWSVACSRALPIFLRNAAISTFTRP